MTETHRLNQLADRAFMRSCALQYRSTIAADYTGNLTAKANFGVSFLRGAILARKASQKPDWRGDWQ